MLKSSRYTKWAIAAALLSIAVTGCGTAAYEKRMSESVSARRIVVSKNRAKEAKDKNNPDQPAAGQPAPAQAAPAQPAPAQPAPAQPAAPAGS